MKRILKKIYERFALNALGIQDYRKASYYFKKIVDTNPQDRGVHYNYAVSLIGSRQYALAEKHLLNELNISGDRYEILKTLGELYYTNNNSSKALEFLKKAIEHCTDEKDAASIRKKITVAGDSRKYSNMLEANSMFERASSHLDNEQWQEACVLFKQALDYDRENPLIYNNLGVISLNHEKKYRKAKIYFEKALAYSDLPIIKRNLSKAEFHILKEAKNAQKTQEKN
jgi:tetratricopeptide (TPR) repeat protein